MNLRDLRLPGGGGRPPPLRPGRRGLLRQPAHPVDPDQEARDASSASSWSSATPATSCSPTAGERVVERARVVLGEADDIERHRPPGQGPRVGQHAHRPVPDPRALPAPPRRAAAPRRFPSLELLLVEEKTEVSCQRLRDGPLDVGILALPVHDDQLHEECLFAEDFVLAVPPTIRWPRDGRTGRHLGAGRRARAAARGGPLPARPGPGRVPAGGARGARRLPGHQPRDAAPDGGGRRRRHPAARAGGAAARCRRRPTSTCCASPSRSPAARSPCSGVARASTGTCCPRSPTWCAPPRCRSSATAAPPDRAARPTGAGHRASLVSFPS